MTVTLKSKDAQAIRKLIPLTTLSASVFDKLLSVIKIEEGPKGTVLFKQGDQKNEFVYLLDGNISLQAAGMEMDSIKGGSEAARFALAHQVPRKVFAVAKDKVRFIRVDAEFLNATSVKSDKSASYEVSDIPEESSDDWMTTLLKSPIFQRLPAANLQKVLTGMEEQAVKAGQLVVTQGESGDYYYIIKRGRCSLTRKPSKNAREIKLAELKTTDTFGEDSLISGEPRNVSITMLTDGALLRLKKDDFLTLIKKPVIRHIDLESAIDESKNGSILLDVRTPDTFEKGHIEGSINAPFFSLRMQLPNFDPKAKQIVICEDGNTSEAATFLLIRHGFDAVVLKGGYQTGGEDIDRVASNTEMQTVEDMSTAAEEAGPGIDEKKQAVEDTQQIIGQLQKQLQNEQQKRKAAEQNSEKPVGGDSGLGRQNQALEQQLLDLKQQLESVRAERNIFQKQIQEIESTRNAVHSQSEKQQRELQNALDSALKQLQESESGLQDTRNELKLSQENSAQLSDQVSQLKQDANQAKISESGALKKRNEEIEGQKNQQQLLQKNIKRLEAEIGKLGTDLDAKARKLEAAESESLTLKSRLEALSGEQSKQETELREESNAQENKLTAEIAELTQLNKTLEEDARARQAELNEKIADLEQAGFELENAHQETLNELQKTQDTGDEFREQLNSANTLRKTLEEQISELSGQLKEVRKNAEEDNSSLSTRQKKLQENFAKLESEKSDIESELRKQTQECENLRAKLDESKTACEQFETELDTRSKNQNESEQQAKSTEANLIRRIDELEKSRQELGEAVSNLESKLDENSRSREQLQTELDKAIRSEKSAQTELAKVSKKYESAQTSIAEYKNELSSLGRTSSESEQELIKLNEDMKSLSSKLEETEHQNEELEESRTSLQQKLEETEKLVGEQQSRLETLQKSESELTQTAEHDSQLIRKLESEKDQLQEKITELENSNTESSDSIASLNEAIRNLTDDRDSLQAESEKLNQQIDKLEQSVDGREDKITTLTTDVDRLTESESSLRASIDERTQEHEKALDEYRQQMEELNDQLVSARSVCAELESEKQALESTSSSRNEELQTLRKTVTDLESELERTLQNTSELQENFEELSHRYDQDQKEAETRVQKLTADIGTLTQEQSESVDQVETLKVDLQKLGSERDDLDLKKQELLAEVATLQQDLEKMDVLEQKVIQLQDENQSRQDRFTEQEETYQQLIDDQENVQADLKDKIAALEAEASEIRRRLGNKSEALQEADNKLISLSKDNAILERHMEDLKNSDPESRESSSQLDELRKEIALLEEQNGQFQKNHSSLNENIEAYRKQNDELKSVVREFMDQAEQASEDDNTNALKTELDMIRSQAESDVLAMQNKLSETEAILAQAQQELSEERRKVEELTESSSNQALPLNPELTPVDRDVFSIIEEEQPGPPGSQSPVAKASGKAKFFFLVFGTLLGMIATTGFLVASDSGKQILTTIIQSELSAKEGQNRSSNGQNHTDNANLPDT